jgi:hypothetical protein
MKMPWAGKSGLAKAATVFAALLVVSIGLCGANFAAWIGLARYTVQPIQTPWRAHLANGVVFMGVLELVGMAVGGSGLVVVGLVAGIRALVSRGGGNPGG